MGDKGSEKVRSQIGSVGDIGSESVMSEIGRVGEIGREIGNAREIRCMGFLC